MKTFLSLFATLALLFTTSFAAHASSFFGGGGGSGATIGGGVTGGTDNAILFVDPASTLAQDPSFFVYDKASTRLCLGCPTPSNTFHLVGTARFASLSTGLGHFDSSGVLTSSLLVNADVSASAAIAYSKLNLALSIVNADVSASAAIAYSKLAIANSIVNADVNSSAAIAYSKLNLTGSIVDADVSASAAIAYSKLNLATSIVNADVSASAAIAYSKLASLSSANILLGSAGNIATSTAVTGDVTIGNTGVTAIGANKVLDTMIRQGGALSIIGRSASSTGNVADISAASDNQVLRRSGTSLGFGSIDLSQSNTVGSSILALANGGTGVAASVLSKTTTYAIATTDSIILGSGSAFTMTLPTAVGVTGKQYWLKKTDSTIANIVTIATTSSQTIDGFTTYPLATGNEEINIVSDGANWQVLAHVVPSALPTFTLSPSAGFGTTSAYAAQAWRVGNRLRAVGYFTAGTTTAGTASLGLPSGYALDTTNFPTTIKSYVGSLSRLTGAAGYPGANFGPFLVTVDTSNTGALFVSSAGSSTTAFAAASGSGILASNDGVSFEFEIPISGWRP